MLPFWYRGFQLFFVLIGGVYSPVSFVVVFCNAGWIIFALGSSNPLYEASRDADLNLSVVVYAALGCPGAGIEIPSR